MISNLFLQALGEQADLSGLAFFAPIFVFLIVFAVMYALFKKSEIIGETNFIQLFVAFLIATVFVTAGSVQQVVLNVIPWFVVLLVALFFILVMAGFIGKKEDFVGKGVGWVFIVLLILVFVISGVKVFSGVLGPYIPGAGFGVGGDPEILTFLDWLYSPRVLGAGLLILAAAIVSWILVKVKKGD